MNTNKLKAYAPKARLAFMDAVKKRAAVLGIYENKISEALTQGTDTLIEGRIFTRKQGQQRQQLVNRIEALGGGKDGYNQFINEMAFTWFNRFTAIRFMEVNGYLDHGFRMLSKEEDAEFGQGFEILAHAADVAEDLGLNKADIVEMLLAGDKEEELYRELLLAQCHQLSKIMPFMFEKLDDATELLLPDNLTKTDSILKELVNDVPEDNWREIEVIGWLYQFYISEHKDAVIGKVVKKEDIPAATQLFTPNWIVKYLVQNSLGRQWLATYPDSDLKEKMEYYITPAEQSDDVIEQLKAITPTSIDPERIKVLDPACGSGHILVEVYEVLREIYLERGYRLREIPELILTKNIYGLDIDDRAAQMAAFAVLMKAREDDRRIFSRIEDNDIKLNIYSIQSTEHLDINKLWADLDLDDNKQAGSMDDLFAEPQLEIAEPSAENQQYLNLLRYLKAQFIDAKTLGSLIQVDSKLKSVLDNFRKLLEEKTRDSNPTTRATSETLLPVVNQAMILANKYDVCVANPPYMGSKYQAPLVKTYLKDNFKGYEKDLFSAFIIRNLQLTREHGELGFMTPFVWMFISSYEELRSKLINDEVISSLVQLEYSGFDGATVPICTFTLSKKQISDYKGSYIRLTNFKGATNQGPKTLEAIKNQNCGWFFEAKTDDFNKIPGKPIAYWLPLDFVDVFAHSKAISDVSKGSTGLQTSNSELFLRYWWETPVNSIKWYPLAKGGQYRKWYGNVEHVVNWENNGVDIKTYISNRYPYLKGNYSLVVKNESSYFQSGILTSRVTSGKLAFRVKSSEEIYSDACTATFPQDYRYMLGILNSNVIDIIQELNPTINFQASDLEKIPFIENIEPDNLISLVQKAIDISRDDWEILEKNRGFGANPLVISSLKTIENCYLQYEHKSMESTKQLYALECSINDLVLPQYKLDSDIISNGLESVSLNQNLTFKYGNEDNDRYRSDSISELLSYSLGCMMGRFSLDREGLVYAHSGNQGFKELVAEGAYKTFPADDDGIVPLAAEEWLFDDDATSRFRDFVKTVWGEEHLQENLDFVAESLCLDAIKPKKNESSMETIRRYFSTQFYKDHLKTYKKRPIYWLFSSGKEKAFECLVYLHRYNESTLARMRTEYVTPLMGKLETQHSVLTESRTNASSTEQRRIDKELKSIEKKQSELRAFDEELKHLAEMKISIDLDDGVKVNYGKFGNLLADVKAIHGKKPEEIK
ncbi:BREX-1 system adenine-specific DNA-methyltransferase PglX [Vibrio parahaemolyticus]|uniref:BREX-1 system adenine-specific DNA-methyltransferase PglX n=1 Tax=Vibrio parahaemolyticus TaxID=670 RepID=UPI00215C792F|nr:BREX-1 system adenine-specific DNA-methyltransferase PglX [Vibrio parahaemolyticus]MCR9764759.1 BREX-1 system adenine-specific DNA-methyltransferase PglX [Vibrio parahaemolyticus]MEA5307927.1 BREX-1 system adenine-specific DNA-methyltransferase PglX [Vibrio parahaemolyticus]HCD5121000.1 BREX-1 system adenine-specific DNA-methyltransferase PglX [Vibrio parahaemolyticus]